MTQPQLAAVRSFSQNDTLRVLLQLRGWGDQELAGRVGMTRQSIWNKRVKGRSISGQELFAIAAALEVPIELFDLETYTDGAEVALWVAHNRPDWFTASSDNNGQPSPAQESAHSRCTVPWTGHITDSGRMSDVLLQHRGELVQTAA